MRFVSRSATAGFVPTRPPVCTTEWRRVRVARYALDVFVDVSDRPLFELGTLVVVVSKGVYIFAFVFFLVQMFETSREKTANTTDAKI